MTDRRRLDRLQHDLRELDGLLHSLEVRRRWRLPWWGGLQCLCSCAVCCQCASLYNCSPADVLMLADA